MSTQEALQSLYDEHGTLTPSLVVAAAVDPSHELHPRFVWDDSEAAKRYRLVQASGLIRSVHIRIDRGEDSEPVRVRAFVADREMSLSQESPDSEDLCGTYRPVEEVVASDVLRTAWFLTVFPGTMLVLTVLSLNLVGDALNDALNPRLRGVS